MHLTTNACLDYCECCGTLTAGVARVTLLFAFFFGQFLFKKVPLTRSNLSWSFLDLAGLFRLAWDLLRFEENWSVLQL